MPAGKALIITGADFYAMAVHTSSLHSLELDVGPAAAPCQKTLAAVIGTEAIISQSQVFSPGIPVPAGDAVGSFPNNDNGELNFYGYLVPAAAVPHSALNNVVTARPGGLRTVTPPR